MLRLLVLLLTGLYLFAFLGNAAKTQLSTDVAPLDPLERLAELRDAQHVSIADYEQYTRGNLDPGVLIADTERVARLQEVAKPYIR